MRIREIEMQDVAVIAQYEKEISIISFGDEAVTDLEFHKKKITKSITNEKSGMLVLEADGKLIGWLWMTPRINSVNNENYVNFKSFYVAETSRGSEYVDMLMDAGMEFCRKAGASRVTGKVHVKNLPMRVLYKKYGFEPTHLTMEYYFKD